MGSTAGRGTARPLPVIVLIAVAWVSSSCGIIYTNVTAPHAYRSATPGDVKTNAQDEMATGTSCARSVGSVPRSPPGRSRSADRTESAAKRAT